MLSKNLRNKVIAGVLGVSLVGGTVFAATPGAGAQLQTWYDGQFKTSAAAVGTALYNYGTGKISELNTWFTNTGSKTVANVESAKSGAISDANKNINDTANQYATEINNKWTDINNGMKTQYDDVVSGYNSTVSGYGTQGVTYANGKIKDALDKEEIKALGDVTNEVGAQQKTSEDALKAVIASAKKDIGEKMAAKQSAATQAVRDYLDAEIKADEKLVEDATAKLEQAKKDSIDLAAAAAQKTATDSLDSIVAGITQ